VRDLRLALVAAISGLGLFETAAHADGSELTSSAGDRHTTVVIVGTVDDHALIGRLASEVLATRFNIDLRVVEIAAEALRNEVDLAVHSGARVVIDVDSRSGRIDSLFVDPTTHVVTLKVSLEAQPMPALEPVLALRTTEFVRATLIGFALPEPDALLSPISSDRTVRSRGLVGMSFGIAGAEGGLRAQGEVGLQLRLLGTSFGGFQLLVLAPVTQEPVGGAAATNAMASVWLGGGDAFVRGRLRHEASVEVGLGAVAVAMRVTGDPSAGWTGGTKTGLGAGAYVRIGGGVALTRSLTARIDLVVGGVPLRPVASAGGPTTYPWGYGFGVALAGIEARVF